jgi:hypothetical protein
VRAAWWWEGRLGGGIEVCQELDPEAMSRKIAEKGGREPSEVRQVVEDELRLQDTEPVVLTFEIPGDTEAFRAADPDTRRALVGARGTRRRALPPGRGDRARIVSA